MSGPTKTILTTAILIVGAGLMFFRDVLLTDDNPAVRTLAKTIESVTESATPVPDGPSDSDSLPVLALKPEPKVAPLGSNQSSTQDEHGPQTGGSGTPAGDPVPPTRFATVTPPETIHQGESRETAAPAGQKSPTMTSSARQTAQLPRPGQSRDDLSSPTVAAIIQTPAAVTQYPERPLLTAARTPVIDTAVKHEAAQYIRRISRPLATALPATSIDHFVTADQVIELPRQPVIEVSSAQELLSDPKLTLSSPITMVKQTEQIIRVSPRDLIAHAQGNLDTPIKVLDKETVRETTVRHLLQTAGENPKRRLKIIQNVDYFVVTTVSEIVREQGEQGGRRISGIRVIKGPYMADKLSITDLLPQHPKDGQQDHIYYVRTVREGDIQGIWGIIHSGLVDNFARGMAIRRGERVDTYRVEIPHLADELEVDQSSSYLGRLLHRKVRASHVYNHRKKRMGRNPDQVFPGQEIVIVDFSADELIAVYDHFLKTENSS